MIFFCYWNYFLGSSVFFPFFRKGWLPVWFIDKTAKSCLVPRRLSRARKGRREGDNRREVASPTVCTLPMVACGSSPVAPIPCEKRSSWGGGCAKSLLSRMLLRLAISVTGNYRSLCSMVISKMFWEVPLENKMGTCWNHGFNHSDKLVSHIAFIRFSPWNISVC